MANSKLLGIIQSFSGNEKEEFVLFLKSPFFLETANAEGLVGIFHFITENLDNHSKQVTDKQLIHIAGYPDKVYSEARLERALAKLGQLAEQFLLITDYQKEEHEQHRTLRLARIYRDRDLHSLVEKKLQVLGNSISAIEKESSENYLLRYQITNEQYEWLCILNQGNGDLTIPTVINNLDLFYLNERTHLFNHLLMQQWTASSDFPNIPQLVLNTNLLIDRYLSQSPLLLLHIKTQELLLQHVPSKEGFYALMDLINQYEASLTPNLINEFYTYLRNFCTLLINHGHKQLYEVLDALQRDNLKRGYFYFNNQILPHGLFNITRVALYVNNIAWTKEFIESHRYRILTDSDSEGLYKISMAFCFFKEKKFEEAMQHLAFPMSYPSFLLQARRLEVMIYFEIKSDLLLYKMDAFRKFLERTATKKVSNSVREMNINFINILLQLTQSKPKDAKRSNQIIKRIEEKTIVAESSWLMEKAQELL